MTRKTREPRTPARKRFTRPPASGVNAPGEGYVGPGHPPKEFRFKPGQSGNPKGRRQASTRTNFKALIEEALAEKVTLRQGEREHIVSKREAGIQQLVNAFAKGDRYARRDLIDLAARVGVDLVAGRGAVLQEAIETTLAAEDEALLVDFVRRQGGTPDWFADDVPTTSAQGTEKPGKGGRQE
jgi:Family of unknown function (DUF5681)